MLIAAAALMTCTAGACAPERSAFREAVLIAHNHERAPLCERQLVWSDRAAADAERWARRLAALGKMQHSDDDDGQGENLFVGTAGAFTVQDMIGFWVDEKQRLAALRDWTDDFEAVGHYTQMVWSTTTAVGCAVASDSADDYLVCRYIPAGNVDGEQPYGRRREVSNRAPCHSDETPDMAMAFSEVDPVGITALKSCERPASRRRSAVSQTAVRNDVGRSASSAATCNGDNVLLPAAASEPKHDHASAIAAHPR